MEEKKDFRHIVRIANTDLDGNKQILFGLRKIRGVNNMFANAVCAVAGVERTKKVGLLADEEIRKLDEVTRNPYRYNIPDWLYNRRKDPERGEDRHLVGPEVGFVSDSDIKRMKMIKSYKGVRHSLGLPARGQRTKSNFRKSKRAGKGGMLGVKKRAGMKGGRV
jgi:small subunit ribosomal protein S13